MVNEIRILVRTQNSAKAGMDQVNRDMEVFAKESSEKFTKTFSDRFNKDFTETITTRLRTVGDQAQGAATQTGDKIGNTIGRRITDKINERVKVDVNGRLRDELGRIGGGGNGGQGGKGGDAGRERVKVNVDVDKQSLLSRMFGAGKEAEGKFEGGFKSSMQSFFGSDIVSMILKGLGFAALGIALAPIIGASITAAIGLALGGGAIAIGIAGAFKDPRIQAAAKGTLDRVKGLFADFSANFKGPLEDFFAPGNGGGGGLVGVITQITPMVEHLGQVLGPVAGQLGQGIIGMLQNMLPGILRAIEKSAPLITTLADKLPGIGTAMGKFFDRIGNGAPQASKFLADFLEGLQFIIRALGFLIQVFTETYGIFRELIVTIINIFKEMWKVGSSAFMGLIGMAGDFLDAVSTAFGWIPGIGGKLKASQASFKSFKDYANKQLNGIDKNVNINVRIAFGNAWAAISNITARLKSLGYIGRAAGGVVGHAAEGGGRSGLTLVGEQGPELVTLPAGSQVHTAGDSRRMMADSGGQGAYVGRLLADRTTERGLVDVLMSMLRVEIFRVAGGDVQQALGRG
jgi:hypothetical protein